MESLHHGSSGQAWSEGAHTPGHFGLIHPDSVGLARTDRQQPRVIRNCSLPCLLLLLSLSAASPPQSALIWFDSLGFTISHLELLPAEGPPEPGVNQAPNPPPSSRRLAFFRSHLSRFRSLFGRIHSDLFGSSRNARHQPPSPKCSVPRLLLLLRFAAIPPDSVFLVGFSRIHLDSFRLPPAFVPNLSVPKFFPLCSRNCGTAIRLLLLVGFGRIIRFPVSARSLRLTMSPQELLPAVRPARARSHRFSKSSSIFAPLRSFAAPYPDSALCLAGFTRIRSDSSETRANRHKPGIFGSPAFFAPLAAISPHSALFGRIRSD